MARLVRAMGPDVRAPGPTVDPTVRRGVVDRAVVAPVPEMDRPGRRLVELTVRGRRAVRRYRDRAWTARRGRWAEPLYRAAPGWGLTARRRGHMPATARTDRPVPWVARRSPARGRTALRGRWAVPRFPVRGRTHSRVPWVARRFPDRDRTALLGRWAALPFPDGLCPDRTPARVGRWARGRETAWAREGLVHATVWVRVRVPGWDQAVPVPATGWVLAAPVSVTAAVRPVAWALVVLVRVRAEGPVVLGIGTGRGLSGAVRWCPGGLLEGLTVVLGRLRVR
nr:hypothetical protein Ade03nite_06110 [Actinoplanes derwentensis]